MVLQYNLLLLLIELENARLNSLYSPKAPVNDILVSAPEIVSSKTRAGGSLSLSLFYCVIICYIQWMSAI